MKRRFLIIIVGLISGILVHAQTEVRDTLSERQRAIEALGSVTTESVINNNAVKPAYSLPNQMQPQSAVVIDKIRVKPFLLTPGMATIYGWESGRVVALGNVRSMPGLGAYNSGAIQLQQQFGNLSVFANMNAEKYGFYRSLITRYGISGSVRYDFNPHLAIVAFGSYYGGSHGYVPPAVAEMMSYSTFGGYLDWRINENWGVRAGAQAVQRPGYNTMRVQPIVMPYYKFSNGVEIGVDLGGIIYNAVDNQNKYRNNPTIAPPKSEINLPTRR